MARPYVPVLRRVMRPNVMALAKRQAIAFTPAEMQQIRDRIEENFGAVRDGRGTRERFAGVCTCCKLGQAIESKGVVRGLAEQFAAAERLLLQLKREAERDGGWIIPVPTGDQVEILAEMVRLHLFQLRQLSYGEYQDAWQLMIGRVTSAGGTVLNPTQLTKNDQ